MAGANNSQVAFARAIVRFAGYDFAVNFVLFAWAIWAFAIGIPDEWFWPSLWATAAIWVGGTLYLVVTILLPAINARTVDQDREKGLR